MKLTPERREWFHVLRLNERLDQFNPAVQQMFQQGEAFFVQHVGDPVRAHMMSLDVLGKARNQQALSLAYFDVFWFLAAVSVVLIFLLFLMQRSVAEKGAHIGAE